MILAVEGSGSGDGWTCSDEGLPAPLSAYFAVIEKDNAARTVWEVLSSFPVGFCAPNVAGNGELDLDDPLCLHEADDVDPVGERLVVWNAADLSRLRVGESRTRTYRMDYCSRITSVEHAVCGSSAVSDWLHGVYDIAVRVRRLPNKSVIPPVQ